MPTSGFRIALRSGWTEIARREERGTNPTNCLVACEVDETESYSRPPGLFHQAQSDRGASIDFQRGVAWLSTSNTRQRISCKRFQRAGPAEEDHGVGRNERSGRSYTFVADRLAVHPLKPGRCNVQYPGRCPRVLRPKLTFIRLSHDGWRVAPERLNYLISNAPAHPGN